VSDHALDRIRERSGVNKKAAQKLAEKAYIYGLRKNDITGNLSDYLTWAVKKSKYKGIDAIVHGDKVFLFSNLNKCGEIVLDDGGNRVVTLITVLQLPTRLDNIRLRKYKKVR
jgi:hypothetical protein